VRISSLFNKLAFEICFSVIGSFSVRDFNCAVLLAEFSHVCSSIHSVFHKTDSLSALA
jgi:hypothetical protein